MKFGDQSSRFGRDRSTVIHSRPLMKPPIATEPCLCAGPAPPTRAIARRASALRGVAA